MREELTEEMIEEMRAAQPKEGEVKLWTVAVGSPAMASFAEAILTAKLLPPADDTVNVLRCRECEYLKTTAEADGGVCREVNSFRQKDDYCSRGKRRATDG